MPFGIQYYKDYSLYGVPGEDGNFHFSLKGNKEKFVLLLYRGRVVWLLLLRSKYPLRVRAHRLHAISNVLMPLLLEAGEEGGFENLVWHKIHLRSGIYLFKGALTNFHLSQRFDLKYTDLNLLIASQR
jgi:hypothetical protein